MTIVTRFAPSPTGFLHIGGARTALFNWLYARRHGGTYRLRIEDTDRARSTPEAVEAILDGLAWLDLPPDGEVVHQSARAARHAAAAAELLESGQAYRCWCAPEELEAMRAAARAAGQPVRYDGRWRDRDPSEAPAGAPFTVRLKAPRDGATTIHDLVQGPVTVDNAQLDDYVLLRADGSPTYMLSVVVDDHDMGVTHVIRGDDHLTNAFRQHHLYRALGWETPRFAHIPLIHGPDGAKLSKRHGAVGVQAYRDMGYLPEALCAALVRLGWSHGDAEFIGRADALKWFDLDAVGRSAARFDPAKLLDMNARCLRAADDARLVSLVQAHLGEAATAPEAAARLLAGMAGLKQRARTVVELTDSARFYAADPPMPPENARAAKLLSDPAPLAAMADALEHVEPWTEDALEEAMRALAAARDVGLGKVAQPLRAALTGSTASPGLFEVMRILGRADCLRRLRRAAGMAAGAAG